MFDKQMANRDCCNMIFCDYKTQIPFLHADFCNVATAELTGEPVFAYGGQGHPKKIGFNGERGGTISFETQIQTYQLYSLITGAKVQTAGDLIKRVEKTASSTTITLDETPISGTVFVFNEGDDCGTLAETTVTGTSVTVPKAGNYIIYYQTALATDVQKLSITATTFPKAFTAYGDTYYVTEDDEYVDCQLKAYKCIPQSNISLSFSNTGDPASLTVTCDLMGDKDNQIIDFLFKNRQ